ncbi:hypothetical protein Hanom_Chr09g00848731 [Helianthus anomalus]
MQLLITDLDNRSEDESDEIIILIVHFIICSFSFVIFPLTSITVAKSIGAMRSVFVRIGGAFAPRQIAYVS